MSANTRAPIDVVAQLVVSALHDDASNRPVDPHDYARRIREAIAAEPAEPADHAHGASAHDLLDLAAHERNAARHFARGSNGRLDHQSEADWLQAQAQVHATLAVLEATPPRVVNIAGFSGSLGAPVDDNPEPEPPGLSNRDIRELRAFLRAYHATKHAPVGVSAKAVLEGLAAVRRLGDR